MKHLYAPWRKKYVEDIVHGKKEKTEEGECPFCLKILSHEDEKNFILARFKYFTIMLNLYPYNAGHILIVSNDHKNCLKNISAQARHELMELTNESINILTDVLKAEGINVGLNIGKASGAGIPAHLHQHVLPRWVGDTNFLPLLAHTKQISVDLEELFLKLKPYFEKLTAHH
ncbi:MAG: HIT domain-containing protein [Candidatus Babeliales bacterium]